MPGQSSSKKIPAADKPTYGLGLGNKPTELPLPSGNTCLAIRPGAQGLIKAKLLDSLDGLTAIVQVDHIDVNDPRKMAKKAQELGGDMSRLADGLELVDKVIAFVVKQPRVWLDEQEIGEDGQPLFVTQTKDGKEIKIPIFKPRDPEKLYADEVDLDDKMFIFQWSVGGSSDLESFRKESERLMGALSDGKDL